MMLRTAVVTNVDKGTKNQATSWTSGFSALNCWGVSDPHRKCWFAASCSNFNSADRADQRFTPNITYVLVIMTLLIIVQLSCTMLI